MKKIFFGFLACAALFVGLTSCNNEVDNPSGKDEVKLGPVRIVIGCQSDDTKVYYNDVNDSSNKIHLQPYWEVGDKVLVLYEDSVSELEIESIIGDGTKAIVEGIGPIGVKVQMVYQKGISAEKWNKHDDEIPGLCVDYTEQEIDYDQEKGVYHIEPVVLAGAVDVDSKGYGSGQLDYLCGIVKVNAVKGIPAGQKITKISLWGNKICKGKYTYDKTTNTIKYKETQIYGSTNSYCDELSVVISNVEVLEDPGLQPEVFFAVPAGATLKQATVTTDKSFYFHNIDPKYNTEGTRVTELGKYIDKRDYFNIEEFKEYYFTVYDWHSGDGLGEVENPKQDAKMIQLAPGNLYANNITWDENGVAIGNSVTFHFEDEQWYYRNIPGADDDAAVLTSSDKTPDGTCGSFLWSEWSNESYGVSNGNNAYSKTMITKGPNVYSPDKTITSENKDNSKFWTNDVGFKVEGEPANYQWRTLTANEWKYLLCVRRLPEKELSSSPNTNVFTAINNVNGVIVFHDNYIGPRDNLTYIPDGCAFLPAAGCRTGNKVDATENNQDGSYWSCSLKTYQEAALMLFFKEGQNKSYFKILESNGRPIRLARDLPEPENPTGD